MRKRKLQAAIPSSPVNIQPESEVLPEVVKYCDFIQQPFNRMSFNISMCENSIFAQGCCSFKVIRCDFSRYH